MAKFVFRLSAVLRQRDAVEKMRRADVARLDWQRVDSERGLTGCRVALDSARADLRDMLSPAQASAGRAIDPRGAGLQAAASLSIDASARRRAVQLAGIHQRLLVARRLLAEAVMQRRAVEMLRDRQFAEWVVAQRKIESAVMDEIAQRMAQQGAETGEDKESDVKPWRSVHASTKPVIDERKYA